MHINFDRFTACLNIRFRHAGKKINFIRLYGVCIKHLNSKTSKKNNYVLYTLL